MTFKAEKARPELVNDAIAVISFPGVGKTLSSLFLARGIVGESGRILMIDTDGVRGNQYGGYPGVGDYDRIEIAPPYELDKFIEAIRFSEREGYNAAVFDSITDYWNGSGGVLDYHSSEAQRIGGKAGNMLAWNTVKKHESRFTEAVKNARIPLLFTAYVKEIADVFDSKAEKEKVARNPRTIVPDARAGYKLKTVVPESLYRQIMVSAYVFPDQDANGVKRSDVPLVYWDKLPGTISELKKHKTITPQTGADIIKMKKPRVSVQTTEPPPTPRPTQNPKNESEDAAMLGGFTEALGRLRDMGNIDFPALLEEAEEAAKSGDYKNWWYSQSNDAKQRLIDSGDHEIFKKMRSENDGKRVQRSSGDIGE